MKRIITSIFILTISITALLQKSQAQCTWQTEITDGYEYTTVCPEIIPGTVWHYTPQTFAVHGGATSLYLNFQDCSGSSGTCAGAKVYERKITVCRNQPLRFSLYLTTSFAGNQSNVRIKVSDSNGNTLDNQASIACDYAPLWTYYQSTSVVPTSDTVIFTMYTNVGGSPGNDLSIDDFMMEKCVGGNAGNSTSTGGICTSSTITNLYPMLGVNDTTGTWSGPSALGNGYHGAWEQGVNPLGAYVYANHFFGPGVGCPLAYDTLDLSLLAPPVVNLGADTTLCTNQSVLLNAGSTPGNTYLWSNGVTGPNALAFTTGGVAVTNTYSVTVTAANGCSNRDTILVNFVLCTGLYENNGANGLSVYPNPTHGEVYVNYDFSTGNALPYSILNTLGEVVATGVLNSGSNMITLPKTEAGIYWIQMTNEKGIVATQKLIISK